jgi:hypothetical protein
MVTTGQGVIESIGPLQLLTKACIRTMLFREFEIRQPNGKVQCTEKMHMVLCVNDSIDLLEHFEVGDSVEIQCWINGLETVDSSDVNYKSELRLKSIRPLPRQS